MEEKKANLIVSPPVMDILESVAIKDKGEAWECIETLYYYVRDGKEPDPTDFVKNIVFKSLKAMLDTGKARYEKCITNGKKGGRPPKEQTYKQEYTPEVITPEETTQESTNEHQRQVLQYLQDVATSTGLTPERLNYYKEKFDAHCRASNKTHKYFDDWKQHFYAWLNKAPRTPEEKREDEKVKRETSWKEYATQRLQDEPEEMPDGLKDL